MTEHRQLKNNYLDEADRIRLKNIGDPYSFQNNTKEEEYCSWGEVAKANRVKGGLQ